MAEPNARFLSDDEVAQLADALGGWAERHPYLDHPAFSYGGSRALSPRDMAAEVRAGGPIRDQVVRMVRFAMEVEEFSSIVARFQSNEGLAAT
jgi:hypothetical protein